MGRVWCPGLQGDWYVVALVPKCPSPWLLHSPIPFQFSTIICSILLLYSASDLHITTNHLFLCVQWTHTTGTKRKLRCWTLPSASMRVFRSHVKTIRDWYVALCVTLLLYFYSYWLSRFSSNLLQIAASYDLTTDQLITPIVHCFCQLWSYRGTEVFRVQQHHGLLR